MTTPTSTEYIIKKASSIDPTLQYTIAYKKHFDYKEVEGNPLVASHLTVLIYTVPLKDAQHLPLFAKLINENIALVKVSDILTK